MDYKRSLLGALIGSVVFLSIVVFVLLYLSGDKTRQKPAITPTPSRTNVIVSPKISVFPFVPTVTESEEFPEFTGAGPDETTEEERRQINQAFELRNQLPVVQPEFSIEYDYREYLFIVSLNAPYAQNREAFERWRKSAGFGDVQPEKYIFRQV